MLKQSILSSAMDKTLILYFIEFVKTQNINDLYETMPTEKIVNYAFVLYIIIKYGKNVYFTQNEVEIIVSKYNYSLTLKSYPFLFNECIISFSF